MSRLFCAQASHGTGTTVASGHNRTACTIGIAECTPKARASYDAEVTTPRCSGEPPTMRNLALPAPSGSARRATAT